MKTKKKWFRERERGRVKMGKQRNECACKQQQKQWHAVVQYQFANNVWGVGGHNLI